MRLVADEGIDYQSVEALRGAGHDVVWIAEEAPGATDDLVLATAERADAPLLTFDKDFGYLVFMQGRAHAGVMLIRLGGLPANKRAERVVLAVSEHGPRLRGAFAVLGQRGLRIRG